MITDVLRASGMSPEQAATVADVLGWADLRGIDAHGVAWLSRYVQFLRGGAIDPRAVPEVSRPGPARVSVEARYCHGAVAMMQAVQAALAAAETHGVCLATVRNATHAGAVGRYADWAAQRGCAALVLVSGPPIMAYHGARAPSLATSPIAIAVPTAEEPMVLDMATSVVSFGRLRQAAARKEKIPLGWALDDEGRPTTDGTRAAIPLPLGGAKGSGLALMSELLTGVLLGSPILQEHLAPAGKRRHQQNALLLLMKVDAFRPQAGFVRDTGALAALIKALPRAEGIDEIRLPGERSARTARERRAQGIPIPDPLARDLAAVCKAAAVPIPPALQDN